MARSKTLYCSWESFPGCIVVKKKLVIRQEHGIHARPAAKIVETCQNLHSKVTFCYKCNMADGCSILQLLLLAAKKGELIEVTVDGEDEVNALAKITELFMNGSGI